MDSCEIHNLEEYFTLNFQFTNSNLHKVNMLSILIHIVQSQNMNSRFKNFLFIFPQTLSSVSS